MTPFTAALAAEMVVVIAVIVGAAIITNLGAISNAIGWLQ
jgi:hypothetical protein